MMKLYTEGGVSRDAKEFLEGFKDAYRAGVAVEYTEWFLEEFKRHGDAREAAQSARDEWDV